MPTRKLARSQRGRNRHDRSVRIEYRTYRGRRSTRDLTLYRVRVRFDGLVMFDGYDFALRAELTFSGKNVERLTDAETGCSWTGQHAVIAFLLCLHGRERKRTGAMPAVPKLDATDAGRPSAIIYDASELERFRNARRMGRLPLPQRKIR